MATQASELWTGSNGASWPAQWTTGGDGNQVIDIQSNKGRFQTGATGAYTNTAQARLASMPSLTDCELYMTFQQSANAITESYFRVFLRGSNDWADTLRPTSGYAAVIEAAGARLNRNASSTDTTLSAWASKSRTSSMVCGMRFQCSGTTIRFRTWDTSGGEPGTWDHSVTDATYSSGRFQLSGLNGGAGTAVRLDIDDLVITDMKTGLIIPILMGGIPYSPLVRSA
jgi:hypothetical protein